MKTRIALSLIMALGLALAACGETSNPGIGTSPSGPADDDPVAVEPVTAPVATMPVALPHPFIDARDHELTVAAVVGVDACSTLQPVCGIWVAADEETALERVWADEPPNDVMYSFDDTTCGDAISIANARWPGRAVVSYAELVWRRAR